MFEDIKSVYILRHTFSYMIEKRILLLIAHNKRLQSKLKKSLINYKRLSKRYIVYESLNKGKVYNAYDDSLIFEGEYLNGKRHGKGIEYDINGRWEFNGEYLNGEKNGKGIEYKKNGDMSFIGKYLNGEKWEAKLSLIGKGEKNV